MEMETKMEFRAPVPADIVARLVADRRSHEVVGDVLRIGVNASIFTPDEEFADWAADLGERDCPGLEYLGVRGAPSNDDDELDRNEASYWLCFAVPVTVEDINAAESAGFGTRLADCLVS